MATIDTTRALPFVPEVDDALPSHYRTMFLIRRFEEAAERQYKAARIGGYCHLSSGQEAATVGTVAATVTATPVEVTWDLGDGTQLTCDDAGTPYDPGRPPGDQRSSCTHVFTRSSRRLAGGSYQVDATVSYTVSWTATTGEGGALGTLTRSATVPVRLTEAQALIR